MAIWDTICMTPSSWSPSSQLHTLRSCTQNIPIKWWVIYMVCFNITQQITIVVAGFLKFIVCLNLYETVLHWKALEFKYYSTLFPSDYSRLITWWLSCVARPVIGYLQVTWPFSCPVSQVFCNGFTDDYHYQQSRIGNYLRRWCVGGL